VNSLDLVNVRLRLGTTPDRPGTGAYRYGAAYDVDGSGTINALDLGLVRANYARMLPPPPPSAAAAESITQELFGTQPIL
jgi:hypothetical protein